MKEKIPYSILFTAAEHEKLNQLAKTENRNKSDIIREALFSSNALREAERTYETNAMAFSTVMDKISRMEREVGQLHESVKTILVHFDQKTHIHVARIERSQEELKEKLKELGKLNEMVTGVVRDMNREGNSITGRLMTILDHFRWKFWLYLFGSVTVSMLVVFFLSRVIQPVNGGVNERLDTVARNQVILDEKINELKELQTGKRGK